MDPNSPQSRYAMLRTSLEMFGQPPADLDENHLRQLEQRVKGELAISQRLLQGSEALQLVVPEANIEQAYGALVSGFDSEEAFDDTLAYNGLERDSLREALRFELRVEAALELVLRDEATVSEAEAEIYYLQHPERFTLPESRTVAHLLITINEDYPENSREQSRRRIQLLHAECANDGAVLKALAERHSECPSAMQQGVIGRVRAGQLYPQLDAALFAMAQGSVSGVIESEVGLHILYCEAIHEAELLPFAQVKEKILAVLEQRRRKSALKRWLQS